MLHYIYIYAFDKEHRVIIHGSLELIHDSLELIHDSLELIHDCLELIMIVWN